MSPERAKRVSFGAAYHVLTFTYLVMPDAPVKVIADANKPGVRIAIVGGTATSRAARAASKDATFIVIKGVDEGVALLKEGKAASAVPNGKPDALAYLSAFVEEQKASGAVRKSFDDIGLKNSVVAPAVRSRKRHNAGRNVAICGNTTIATITANRINQ